MLSRMSIRTKLTVVIAFLLVAMSAMGLLAVRQMQAINASAVDIQSNWLPSVRALGDLRAGVLTYRNVIRQHLLSEAIEDKTAQEKLLQRIVEGIASIRATYEPLITSPEERALYTEWSQLWDNYKKGSEGVVARSRQNAGYPAYDAQELNAKTVNPIGIKAEELLQKDIDLNNSGSNAAAHAAADNYNFASRMVLIALGLAIVLGLIAGFYLIRDVTTGIASIVTPMKALGEGNLTADVPHQGKKTEIGTMADTLQVFKQALIAKKAADEAAS
ncbi:MAG TPA: MCP four helix bundle domain-containing protein, partial [Afipia sp.]